MNTLLYDKLKTLPNSAGVYFHKNSKNEIIYVGKAANLRNRVRQYFRKSANQDIKTQTLVSEIVDIDWIEVETEIDALFLESEMIKRYKPQFNILLRDDKSPTYVRIGFNDSIPNVSFTKIPMDDSAEYFGPFYAGGSVKKSVRLLRKAFPFYDSKKIPQKNNLNSQIGLTPGLENVMIGSLEFQQKMKIYKKNLRKLARYLQGYRADIQKEIELEMRIAASEERFEDAIKFRNQLRSLNELRKQIIFSREEFLDISKDHALSKLAEILSLSSPPRRIECFDISHTGGENVVASMVVFTNGLADKREYRKFKMKTGGNDDFANMRETLTRRFSSRNSKWQKPDLILIDGGKGQLSAVFDILPDEFKVIGIAKRDEEIIVHKSKSRIKIDWIENNRKHKKGNLRIYEEGSFLIINLHGQYHSRGHARNLLGESNAEFGDLTKFFQRIRDESHRFAISYHSNLRSKSAKKNHLERIAGVGPKTRAKLMKEFGSINKIKEATEQEISKIVGKSIATKIKQNL